jgi:ElaB/YqjD/DUF883 family membrane-anchored ribosome-binding protein
MSNDTTTADSNKEKFVSDMKVLVADSEELLRATAAQAGEKAVAARERIQATLVSTKAKLIEAERALIDKTKQAARVTDDYVHDNPWQAVGIAAGVGFLLGLLIGRR